MHAYKHIYIHNAGDPTIVSIGRIAEGRPSPPRSRENSSNIPRENSANRASSSSDLFDARNSTSSGGANMYDARNSSSSIGGNMEGDTVPLYRKKPAENSNHENSISPTKNATMDRSDRPQSIDESASGHVYANLSAISYRDSRDETRGNSVSPSRQYNKSAEASLIIKQKQTSQTPANVVPMARVSPPRERKSENIHTNNTKSAAQPKGPIFVLSNKGLPAYNRPLAGYDAPPHVVKERPPAEDQDAGRKPRASFFAASDVKRASDEVYSQSLAHPRRSEVCVCMYVCSDEVYLQSLAHPRRSEVCWFVYVCLYTYTCIYIHTYMYTYTTHCRSSYMSTSSLLFVYTYIHTYTYTCIHHAISILIHVSKLSPFHTHT
jgi:hypothetical protein